MQVRTWNIEALTGYKPQFIFYEDFSIAEPFGFKAIDETYEKNFSEYKNDYKALTELVMALNWQCWYAHDNGMISLSRHYQDLFEKASNYAQSTLKGAELSYYYSITD